MNQSQAQADPFAARNTDQLSYQEPLAPESDRPDSMTIIKAETDLINALLDELSKQEQIVLIGHIVDGFTLRQVERNNNWSHGKARYTLTKAINNLRLKWIKIAGAAAPLTLTINKETSGELDEENE
jgi:DNA-directed RNA polymerase sigma subunit (sigma70/sigma32)